MTCRERRRYLLFFAPCIAALLYALQAHAESRIDYSSSSFIEIHEPDEDHRGARAAVTFANQQVHGPGDNRTTRIDLDGFEVEILFEWNYMGGQADLVTVIVPDGYVAYPPEMLVEEGHTDTLWIYGATS